MYVIYTSILYVFVATFCLCGPTCMRAKHILTIHQCARNKRISTPDEPVKVSSFLEICSHTNELKNIHFNRLGAMCFIFFVTSSIPFSSALSCLLHVNSHPFAFTSHELRSSHVNEPNPSACPQWRNYQAQKFQT